MKTVFETHSNRLLQPGYSLQDELLGLNIYDSNLTWEIRTRHKAMGATELQSIFHLVQFCFKIFLLEGLVHTVWSRKFCVSSSYLYFWIQKSFTKSLKNGAQIRHFSPGLPAIFCKIWHIKLLTAMGISWGGGGGGGGLDSPLLEIFFIFQVLISKYTRAGRLRLCSRYCVHVARPKVAVAWIYNYGRVN